jgi:multidrug efflux system membrane fusion protein
MLSGSTGKPNGAHHKVSGPTDKASEANGKTHHSVPKTNGSAEKHSRSNGKTNGLKRKADAAEEEADGSVRVPTRSPRHTLKSGHRRPRGRLRRWWPWGLVVVVALAIGGAWLLYRQRADARAKAAKALPAPGVPVTAATTRKGDIGVTVEALGTVTPVSTVTVTGRVQGEIMRVDYHEGQVVQVGDSLLEIDPRPYEAALTQAQGQLSHDRAVLQEARIDLARYRSASAQNAIARQVLEDQEQLVLQAEGTVKMDEGTAQSAKVNLAYCHITSPIDGRVGLRLVDPGNIVQSNSTTALVSIAQMKPITVIFSVAEDYLPQIQAPLQRGESLKVDARDRTQEKVLATGSLLALDNMVDTTTGTVRLRAVFANDAGTLFANQFVNASLLVDTVRGASLVPTAAIQRNAQGSFVYVIEADKAALHTIKLGVADGTETAVTGVNPGDVVATSGFDKLKDGAKVSVKAAATADGRQETGQATPASGAGPAASDAGASAGPAP